MTTTGRVRLAAGAALVLVLMTACSSQDPDGQAQQFTAPAWFAQQAQQREQVRNTLQTCLDGKGWNVTVDENGGAAQGFTDEAEMSRYHSDVVDCRQAAGLPVDHAVPSSAEAEQAYRGELDTAACLRAQGVEVAAPPSEDAWVEDYLASFAGDVDPSVAATDDASSTSEGLWNPYDTLARQAANGDGDASSRFQALQATCPQWWVP